VEGKKGISMAVAQTKEANGERESSRPPESCAAVTCRLQITPPSSSHVAAPDQPREAEPMRRRPASNDLQCHRPDQCTRFCRACRSWLAAAAWARGREGGSPLLHHLHASGAPAINAAIPLVAIRGGRCRSGEPVGAGGGSARLSGWATALWVRSLVS